MQHKEYSYKYWYSAKQKVKKEFCTGKQIALLFFYFIHSLCALPSTLYMMAYLNLY